MFSLVGLIWFLKYYEGALFKPLLTRRYSGVIPLCLMMSDPVMSLPGLTPILSWIYLIDEDVSSTTEFLEFSVI